MRLYYYLIKTVNISYKMSYSKTTQCPFNFKLPCKVIR